MPGKTRPDGPVGLPSTRRETTALPRSTDATRPRLSVVIPVYNAESTLAECLSRLCQTTVDGCEVVLVDDGSTDRTPAIAAQFPVRVVRSPGRVGPAVARNIGAKEARGDYLFFVDSDVMVQPGTLARLMQRFEQGDVDGVVGVQAVDMRHRNLPSQYKNLWIRWTYLRKQSQQDDVPVFYTTAAAIRREVFDRLGGFDQAYGNPNVEDQAFGQKLLRAGVRVRVDEALEVEHVKRYSLWSMLKTDFARSVSLARLQLRHRDDMADNHTTIPVAYMASVPLAGLALAAIVLGGLFGARWSMWAGVVGFLATAGLNWEFLREIGRTQGWLRGLGAVPILWLELLVAGTGAAVGVLSFPFGKRY